MDLIDRYVQRVRHFLPGPRRDDIARELAADLRSEVQEQGGALGHPLGRDEISGILERWGHPLLVSARCQPERYLIGPALFPVCWFVLKNVALRYLLPWLVIPLAVSVLSPGYRAAHPGLAVLVPLGTWWSLVIGAVGITTLVFAVLERTQVRLFERWDPRGLPAVTKKDAIPRFSSIVEIVVGSFFILWWTGNLRLPVFGDDEPRIVLTFTASFAAFFWPVLLQSAASLARACVNLFRPWWPVTRTLVHLGINAATAAIAALLLRAGPWVEASRIDPPAGAEVTRLANWGLYWLFLGIGVIAFMVAVLEDGRRLLRLSAERASQ